MKKYMKGWPQHPKHFAASCEETIPAKWLFMSIAEEKKQS
jgi:hypothetical protein